MHPILFEIGPLSLKSYGLMLAISFIIGTFLSTWKAKRVGVNVDRVMDLILIILITSIIGSRLMFVFTYWQDYSKDPIQILKIWEGGLVLYGGILGAVIASFIFVAKVKLPFWKVADILLPCVALGIGITRIGCFLNGCCFGLECSPDFPLGVTFPEGSPASYAGLSEAIHPTQLYSSLGGFLLFAILIFVDRVKKFDGLTFSLFFIIYPIIRFMIEMLRYHDDVFKYGGFRITVSQTVSIALFIFGILTLAYLVYRSQKTRIAEVKNEADIQTFDPS